MTFEIEKSDDEWRENSRPTATPFCARPRPRPPLPDRCSTSTPKASLAVADAARRSSQAPRSSTRDAGGRVLTRASRARSSSDVDRLTLSRAHRDPLLQVRRSPGPRLQRRTDAHRAALLRELARDRLRRSDELNVEEASDRDSGSDRTDHHAHDQHDEVGAEQRRGVERELVVQRIPHVQRRDHDESPRPNPGGPG